ncbi:MAB_1171c family putative transporter [Cryobacterium fucosi]|uniref:DUF6545 domain-containing protein n=1 Tax=Cryobacterium fucosi TaxID=1259157 RepID=A0A4R9AW21_9MICO|nr:MAB_1171c family putative transporter [Cryobacterium fucosi]TFD70970.1 hypothetical protein E3T48_16180 [Cryobacterium fucosi]
MLVAGQLVMAALLWLAALLCLPAAINGRRRLLFWFLAVFALTMTVQPAPVYDVVDAALGGGNITFFAYHAAAIVAVALLNGIVQEATSDDGITRSRRRASIVIVTVIVGVQALLFFGSDWRFTDDYDRLVFNRWDYAVYASTTWFALAYFSVSVAVACLADLPRQRRRVTRVSLVFVALGCLGVLVFALVSIVNATLLSLDQGSGFTRESRGIYFTALITAPICLAVGLGLTTVVDGAASAWRNARDRVLLWRITPLWERLIADSPELSIETPSTRLRLAFGREPGARLYRRYVEVRDSLLLHPRDATTVERDLLDAVERQTHADRAVTGPRRLAPAGTGGESSTEASRTPHTTRLRGPKP